MKGPLSPLRGGRWAQLVSALAQPKLEDRVLLQGVGEARTVHCKPPATAHIKLSG